MRLRLSAAGARLIEQSTRGRRREITRLLRTIPKAEQEHLAVSLRAGDLLTVLARPDRVAELHAALGAQIAPR